MILATNPIRKFAQDQLTLGRIIRWVEIVLVVLLAVALARLVTDLIPAVPINTNSAATGTTVPVERPGRQTGDMVVQISPALRQLFGKPNQAAVPEEDLQQPLQQTSLNLVLKGILADRGSDNRLALIAVGGNKERVYRIGDQIEGAEIIRIETRRIIIRRNGMTEALNLEVRKLSANVSTSDAQRRGVTGNGIRHLGDNDRIMSRATLKQQLNNLPALLQQASAVPYSENGQPAGFRIVNLMQGSVFQQLGLQPNDIINSINGAPINNVEAALNAYRSLGTASSYSVGVRRGGQDIKLNISVE